MAFTSAGYGGRRFKSSQRLKFHTGSKYSLLNQIWNNNISKFSLNFHLYKVTKPPLP